MVFVRTSARAGRAAGGGSYEYILCLYIFFYAITRYEYDSLTEQGGLLAENQARI